MTARRSQRGANYSKWSRTEQALWDEVEEQLPLMAREDSTVRFLYDLAFFDFSLSTSDRRHARLVLSEYLWDEYGVDFDEVFDWEEYRNRYEATPS